MFIKSSSYNLSQLSILRAKHPPNSLAQTEASKASDRRTGFSIFSKIRHKKSRFTSEKSEYLFCAQISNSDQPQFDSIDRSIDRLVYFYDSISRLVYSAGFRKGGEWGVGETKGLLEAICKLSRSMRHLTILVA